MSDKVIPNAGTTVTIVDTIFELLAEDGYRPTMIKEWLPKTKAFYFQDGGYTFEVVTSVEEPDYVAFSIRRFCEFESAADRAKLIAAATKVNSSIKCVKVAVDDEAKNVDAYVQMFCNPLEISGHVVGRIVSILASAANDVRTAIRSQ